MKPIQIPIKHILFVLLLLITACQSESSRFVKACISENPRATEKNCECVERAAREDLTDDQYKAALRFMEGNRDLGQDEELQKNYMAIGTFFRNMEKKCRPE